MVRRIGLMNGFLTLVFIVFVLALGILVNTPKNADAYPDMTEGNCAQCHEDGRKAPGGDSEPAEILQPAQPAAPSGSSDPAQSPEQTPPAEPEKPAEQLQPTQPSEPAQPTQPVIAEVTEPAGLSEAQQVNKVFPIVGFVGAVIVLGGASYLDRRNQR
ncbi:MAG: hypothetical protein APF84_06935 [Gracilibacter sp. BRH_c7a]|nr:MAG: hypothetical protein APF84_06935 [Gracilibacter sp. BRH_c7a]